MVFEMEALPKKSRKLMKPGYGLGVRTVYAKMDCLFVL
jgi:hypothetical protein